MTAAPNRSLIALVGVVFVAMTGFGVFLPVFPFLALYLGATAAQATWAMGAYSLGQLIAAPLWGRLSDRIGRKPVLIAGLLGAAISYLWLAHAQSVIDLAGARLFAGLMAGNIGAAFAAAADLADERTRTRNMGLLGAAVGFAFIAGPFFGAMIAGEEPNAAGFANICYLAAGFAFAALLGAIFLFKETRTKAQAQAAPSKSPWRLLTKNPALARLASIMLLMITAQALLETTYGLWADAELQWGPRQVGWSLAGLGLLAAIMQGGLAGRIARAIGERMSLAIGLIIFAAGFGGLAASSAAPSAMAAIACIAIGIGLSSPALQSLFASEANEADRGAAMGLSQAAAALGRVLGPAIAGFAFASLGHAAPYVLGALILVAALMVAIGARPGST